MFDVPEAVIGATFVRAANVTEKCARIMLHTAFTAPAGSKLFVYGPSLPVTELVVRAARAMCPFGNVGENKSTEFVVHRDDGTSVVLKARPGAERAVRGDDASHLFVIEPGHCTGWRETAHGRQVVFVGRDDAEAARLAVSANW
jgi:hypothetical protein